MNLGANIRAARKARRLTQEQLGKLLDRSRLAVNAWENNRRPPRMPMLDKIASVLATTSSALVAEPAKRSRGKRAA